MMTEDEKKKRMENPPWKSKKFLAFCLIELGLLGWMYAATLSEGGNLLLTAGSTGVNAVLMVVAITVGFVGVGYVLGQAALDRYVRVAALALKKDEDNNEENGDSEDA